MIDLDKVYWCHQHSLYQAMCHIFEPQFPYKVKVIADENSLEAYKFNEETNIVYTDANSTVYVGEEDLFLTQKEALESYCEAMRIMIDDKEKQIRSLQKKIADVNILLSLKVN